MEKQNIPCRHSSLRVAYIDEIEEKTEDGKSQMVYFSVLIKGGKKYDEEVWTNDSRLMSQCELRFCHIYLNVKNLILVLYSCALNTNQSCTHRIGKSTAKSDHDY